MLPNPTITLPKASSSTANSKMASPPPPPSLQAYHQRISQHLMTLMRTPLHTPSTTSSSSASFSSRTRSTVTGTTSTSTSESDHGKRKMVGKGAGREEDSTMSALTSACASTTSSPDIINQLTVRPGTEPHGLGLGLTPSKLPIIQRDPHMSQHVITQNRDDDDDDDEDEEPTPAGPSTYSTIIPNQPSVPTMITREQEHKAAWDAEGRKVWKAMPPGFQLTLSHPKSRRGSNDPPTKNSNSDTGSSRPRRKSEEGTKGNTMSSRMSSPISLEKSLSLAPIKSTVSLPTDKAKETSDLAARMGILTIPTNYLSAVSYGASIQRVTSTISLAASSAGVSQRPTTASTSASPYPSSSTLSKASLPSLRESARLHVPKAKKELPLPLRSVEDELAYETKQAQKMRKKQMDLIKRVKGWYTEVESVNHIGVVVTPPEILPHILSPRIATAHLVASPLESAIALPPLPMGPPPSSTTATARVLDPSSSLGKPLTIIPPTPDCVENTASPFEFTGKTAGPGYALSTSQTRGGVGNVEVELALRLQKLKELMGEHLPIVKDQVNEETLKGSTRKTSGVVDEFGTSLRT